MLWQQQPRFMFLSHQIESRAHVEWSACTTQGCVLMLPGVCIMTKSLNCSLLGRYPDTKWPTIQGTFEKAESMEAKQGPMVPECQGVGELVEHRELGRQYSIVLVGICHYTLVKTHRMHTPDPVWELSVPSNREALPATEVFFGGRNWFLGRLCMFGGLWELFVFLPSFPGTLKLL